MATPYWDELKKAGLKYNVDPALLAAVMHQESGGNPRARSRVGAMGLFQLMPGTARALGVKDPFDPRQSIDGGARYLAEQLRKFGSVPLALAAYNAGPGAVEKYGGVPPYRETQGYVKAITAAYGRAGGAAQAPTGGARSAEAPSTQPVAPPNAQESVQSVAQQPGMSRQEVGFGLLNAIRSRREGDSGALRSLLLSIAASRQASPQAAAAPSPAAMPATPAAAPRSPSGAAAPPASPAGSPLAGIAEAFYDPVGAYDEGRWIAPIGGHKDHVHLSFQTPQKALEAIAVGQRMGLRVSENPYVDHVDPVHVKTSYHYRNFPGVYGGGKRLGEALDASGAPATMAAFYKWATGRSR